MYDFGWRAAVIPLFRGQRRVLAIPRTAGLVVAVDSGPLLRRIDLHGGVHLEQIGQSAHMVTVAVGHNHKIELLQIDARCFHVVFKDLSIVARVEQDAFAAIFD